MLLFRIFPWDGRSSGGTEGGPLYVPRHKQGAGRHDVPEKDGVIYASKEPVSAAAEAIKAFRGQVVPASVFERPDGSKLALATLELDDAVRLVDLDDPGELGRRGLVPSTVASRHRPTTQSVARRLFDEGVAGFLWWSALNASWQNATLFESRVKTHLTVRGIAGLNATSNVVEQAAGILYVAFK